MAAVVHQRQADPRVGDWCAAIDQTRLDSIDRANLREAKRSHRLATLIPQNLAEELARHAALGQSIWADARAKESVADFLPTLVHMVKLKRQQARCLSSNGDDPYDTLLDEFEPGMTTVELDRLFSSLRPGLIALREKIANSTFQPPKLAGTFGRQDQMELATRLATVFNYRWQAGRIDKAVHPFSSGYRSDSRITTRVNPENIFDCLYSTIHGSGSCPITNRAAIRRWTGFPPAATPPWACTKVKAACWKNQIGRSRAFMDWLHPQMQQVLGDFGLASPPTPVCNRKPGFSLASSAPRPTKCIIICI